MSTAVSNPNLMTPMPASPALDPTTKAVVRYLKTAPDALDQEAIQKFRNEQEFRDEDAFLKLEKISRQHSAFLELVKICLAVAKAGKKRSRLFLVDEFTITDAEGRPLRDDAGRIIRDDDTRVFIEDWLAKELEKYQGMSHDEIDAFAASGCFARLPLDCRDALRGEVSERLREPSFIRLDKDMTDEDGGKVPLGAFVGTRRTDAASTLCRLVPFEERMRVVERLREIVKLHAAELKRLDVYDGLRALLRRVDLLVPFYKQRGEYDRNHDNAVFLQGFTEEIQRVRHVSRTGAEAYRRKFAATMNAELDKGNAAVCEIFETLEGPGSNDIGNNRVSPIPFFALRKRREVGWEEQDEHPEEEADEVPEEEKEVDVAA